MTGPSATPARRAPTSSSRSRSRHCTCCGWWIGSVSRGDELPAPQPARDDLGGTPAGDRRAVLGDRRAQVGRAVRDLLQRLKEQALEDAQLARRGAADLVGAREAVPRPGEREEARAAAVAVGG